MFLSNWFFDSLGPFLWDFFDKLFFFYQFKRLPQHPVHPQLVGIEPVDVGVVPKPGQLPFGIASR